MLKKLIDDEDEDYDGMKAKFHDAFEALLPVVEGVFGNALDPLWEIHLTNLEAAYDALKISRTTKVTHQHNFKSCLI
jgi:hypothetical protein